MTLSDDRPLVLSAGQAGRILDLLAIAGNLLSALRAHGQRGDTRALASLEDLAALCPRPDRWGGGQAGLPPGPFTRRGQPSRTGSGGDRRRHQTPTASPNPPSGPSFHRKTDSTWSCRSAGQALGRIRRGRRARDSRERRDDACFTGMDLGTVRR